MVTLRGALVYDGPEDQHQPLRRRHHAAAAAAATGFRHEGVLACGDCRNDLS